MKKLVFLITSSFALAFAVNATAYAHVLINDTTDKKAAILHINPDDDPIAGQSSTIYFDIQDTLRQQLVSAHLTVTNNNDNASKVIQTTTNGSLTTANYTFPVQGIYTLNFLVQTKNQRYTFQQTQLVSRGVSAATVKKAHHQWAESLLFASALSFVILAIIAFNRRKSILGQSTF